MDKSTNDFYTEEDDDVIKRTGDVMKEVNKELAGRRITVDVSRLGKESVVEKELLNGIVLRILNDGSYSIGGNATIEQKNDYLSSLNKFMYREGDRLQ